MTYQGPVLNDKEDHEEMRRIWNEPLPNPDPNATEDGDDSDRQGPRATGNLPFCANQRPILLKLILLVLSSASPGTWSILILSLLSPGTVRIDQ